VLTGLLNTAVGYLLYAAGYYITRSETWALVIDYVLSILFNFKSYSILVFGNKNNSRIFIFTLVYGFVFILNRLSLWLYIDFLNIDPYVSQLIALTYIPIILYLLFKNIVFGKNNQ